MSEKLLTRKQVAAKITQLQEAVEQSRKLRNDALNFCYPENKQTEPKGETASTVYNFKQLFDESFEFSIKDEIEPNEETLTPKKLQIQYRGYMKLAHPAYCNTNNSFALGFLVFNQVELSAFETATQTNPFLTLNTNLIEEVVNEQNQFKILYRLGDSQKGIVLVPLTTLESSKLLEVTESVCSILGLELSHSGELPPKTVERSPQKKISWYQKLDEIIRSSSDEDSWEKVFEEDCEFEYQSLSSRQHSLHKDAQKSRRRANSSLSALARKHQIQNLLKDGAIFLKYGKWGKPHQRFVRVSKDLKLIEWHAINKKKVTGYMSVESVTQVIPGRKTKTFSKFPNELKELSSFSIISKKRTLDLEVGENNPIERSVWLEAFQALIDSVQKA